MFLLLLVMVQFEKNTVWRMVGSQFMLCLTRVYNVCVRAKCSKKYGILISKPIKPVKTGQNRSKPAITGQIRPNPLKPAKTGQNRPKRAQIGQNRPKLAKNRPKPGQNRNTEGNWAKPDYLTVHQQGRYLTSQSKIRYCKVLTLILVLILAFRNTAILTSTLQLA